MVNLLHRGRHTVFNIEDIIITIVGPCHRYQSLSKDTVGGFPDQLSTGHFVFA